MSDLPRAYDKFFGKLLNDFRAKYPGETHTPRNKGRNYQVVAMAGIKTAWDFTRDQRFRIELYIGRRERKQNADLFDALMNLKSEIESDVGDKLDWDRLDKPKGKRKPKACRISYYYYPKAPTSVTDAEPSLDRLIEWASPEMMKFRSAFRPHIQSIPRRPL